MLTASRLDRQAEPAADNLGDFFERHTLVSDTMVGRLSGALLDNKPVEAPGVQPVHG